VGFGRFFGAVVLRAVGTIKFDITQMINLLPMPLLQYHMLAYEFLKFHQELLFIILIVCVILSYGNLKLILR
jgi:hypothetical protein